MDPIWTRGCRGTKRHINRTMRRMHRGRIGNLEPGVLSLIAPFIVGHSYVLLRNFYRAIPTACPSIHHGQFGCFPQLPYITDRATDQEGKDDTHNVSRIFGASWSIFGS